LVAIVSGTYVDLDDLGNVGAGGVKDGLDVVAAGLGQLADVTLDQVGRGVGRDLTGDEDLAVGADGLGLGRVNWGFLWECGLDGLSQGWGIMGIHWGRGVLVERLWGRRKHLDGVGWMINQGRNVRRGQQL
jgi:hypothetical protein